MTPSKSTEQNQRSLNRSASLCASWPLARLAISAFVACPFLFAPIYGKSKADVQKMVDIRSVWKPSQESIRALKEAAANGKGTRQTLLEVMRNGHASTESLLFAASFSNGPAYLSAIDQSEDSTGLTVGEVNYPFRPPGPKTFVILNARPRIIDVTDQELLNHMDISSSKDFKELWGSSMKAECVWSEPVEHNIQLGRSGSTAIEVTYPIKDPTTREIIGFAHVTFDYYSTGRGLMTPALEYISVRRH